jgi:hypothetical protein
MVLLGTDKKDEWTRNVSPLSEIPVDGKFQDFLGRRIFPNAVSIELSFSSRKREVKIERF